MVPAKNFCRSKIKSKRFVKNWITDVSTHYFTRVLNRSCGREFLSPFCKTLRCKFYKEPENLESVTCSHSIRETTTRCHMMFHDFLSDPNLTKEGREYHTADLKIQTQMFREF